MRINSFNTNLNFGKFSAKTAEKMLADAKNKLDRTATGDLIIRAAKNCDYHIKLNSKGMYEIYTYDTSLGGLNQMRQDKFEFKSPNDAINKANELKDSKYQFLFEFWQLDGMRTTSNILDLVTDPNKAK